MRAECESVDPRAERRGNSVEDCVYINGDYMAGPVEWLGIGTDVSKLAGERRSCW